MSNDVFAGTLNLTQLNFALVAACRPSVIRWIVTAVFTS